MSGAGFEETRKRLKERLALIRDLAERASKMPHMTEGDLLIAKEAVSNIDYGERFLFRRLEELFSKDPAAAGDILWSVDHLTAGIMFAVSRTTLSDSALRAADHRRAAEARKKRSDAGIEAETALHEAIKTVLGGRDPSERGAAGRILSRVNKILADGGHAEVKIDVVRRRLNSARS